MLKSILSKAVVLLLLSSCALAQVAVSTKLTGSDGNPVTGAFLRFSLQNCGPNFPIYANTPLVIVKRSVDMPVNGNGQVVGQILPNDLITCGNVASTQWLVQPMRDAATPLNAAQCYIIHSTDYAAYGGLTAAFDPAVAQPCSTTPPAPGFIPIFSNPVGSQTWRQPTNTTGFFQGNFDFTGATVTGLNVAASLFPNCPSGLNSMAVYTGTTTLGCVAAAGSDSSGNVFGLSFTAGGSNNGALFVVGGLPDPSIGNFPLQTFGWLARPFFTSSYFCRVPNTPAGAGDVGKVLALNSWDGTNKICDLAWVTQGQGIADPGVNGIVYRSAFNTSRVATSADVIALFTGTCDSTHALFGDGTCKSISTSFSSLTTGANTQANMQVSTGATVAPLNLGQIAGTMDWMQPGISAPSTTGTLTGGSIGSAQAWLILITLNTAAGETLPSVELSANTQTLTGGTCNSGSACTLTVVAPSLGGYLSYNVYACNTSSGPCTTAQKVAACTAITTNCIFTAPYGTNSSGAPTISTAFPRPPNVQATNGMFGEVPTVFFKKPDGNYYPWVTVDYSTSNNYAAGTPKFTHRTFFSDFGNGLNTSPAYGQLWTTQAGNNAFISINHLYGMNTSQSNQDRALWLAGATPVHDTSTHWALEGLQAELDLNGDSGLTINGSPDGEVSTASLQLQNNVTAAVTVGGYGANLIRAQYYQGQSGQNAFDIGNVWGSQMVFTDNATTNNLPGGRRWTLYAASAGIGNGVNQTGLLLTYYDMTWSPRFAGTELGLWSHGSFTPTAGTDFLIRNDVHNFESDFNSNIYANGLTASDPAVLPVTASANVVGSLSVSQPSMPGVTNTCVGGVTGTTYQYTIVFRDGNGGAQSELTATSSCAATLDGSHFNQLQIAGASSPRTIIPSYGNGVDIYRTTGGATQGKIGSFSCSTNLPINGCSVFNDVGFVGDGNTPPANATNTTGGASFAGYVQAKMNRVQLTSDFTSAANTSLQTITGLSWTLDPAAKNYSFHCSLMYSQATAATSMQFGIQAATANPTNINAKGRVDTSTSAVTSGVLNGLTTTTATAIVTFTPSASATVFGVDLDGSIEEPASAPGNVINIMVQTSNSADLPTVKRGSYCYLY